MNIEMLHYYIYLFFSFSLIFVLTRESIIDIETEYVPNNIIYSSYTISILYIITMYFINKDKQILLGGLLGFLVSFGIPFAFSFISFGIQYLKWKSKHKNEKLPEESDEHLKLSENPKMSKKLTITLYILAGILIILIGILKKNIVIVGIGFLSFIFEYLLSKLYKKYYIIEYNYASSKNIENKDEDEDSDLVGGIGGGDMILFGAIGIMFGMVGFFSIFFYSALAQLIVIIIYSLIKKVNPLNNPIPFVPGIALGVLIYTSGLDMYLFNFTEVFNMIFL